MAFEQERIRKTVIGNMRLEIYKCTFTSVTSGTLVTGLNNIETVSFSADTVRDGTTFDHESTAGEVDIGGVTAGDVMHVTVIGK